MARKDIICKKLFLKIECNLYEEAHQNQKADDKPMKSQLHNGLMWHKGSEAKLSHPHF